MPKVVDQLHSRPPWERMMRIHERIQAEQYPACNQLAREFQVSIRTVKRDIDFMKCRVDSPIEYDSRRYGYYYSKEVEQLPSARITEPELFAPLVAQKAMRTFALSRMRGLELTEQAAAEILRKY